LELRSDVIDKSLMEEAINTPQKTTIESTKKIDKKIV
jgi:hypothetical protein